MTPQDSLSAPASVPALICRSCHLPGHDAGHASQACYRAVNQRAARLMDALVATEIYHDHAWGGVGCNCCGREPDQECAQGGLLFRAMSRAKKVVDVHG